MTAASDFFHCNYFELFGVAPSLNLDLEKLTLRYHALQKQTHPDRYVGSNLGHVATQINSRINDAYQTLSSPLKRIAYFLSLEGIDVYDEKHTQIPVDFLELQIEWRERLEVAEDCPETYQQLQVEINTQQNEIITEAQTAFEKKDFNRLTDVVRRWIYTDKLLQEINT